MKIPKITALILGAALTAQCLPVFAADSAKGTGSAAAAVSEPTHKEKVDTLLKLGIVTSEQIEDETRTITYDDAVISLARYGWYNEDNTDRTPMEWLEETGGLTGNGNKIELKSGKEAVTLGEFADWCLLSAGYFTVCFPDRTALAIEKGLTTDKDKSDDKITAERFTDMLYTTMTLPICVANNIAANGATGDIWIDYTILDGHERGNGEPDYPYETRLSEMLDDSSDDAEAAADAPEDTDEKSERTAAPARAERVADMIADLQTLGIIAKADDLRLGDKVTRAEVSKILAVMLEYSDDMAAASNQTFNDVPKDHWAFEYVEYAYATAVIEGDDDGNFMPETNVTMEQLCKMLVCLTGYKTYAENRGGWPVGYLTQAAALGITRDIEGIANMTELTREQVMIMAYNTLDVPLCVIDSYETATLYDGSKVQQPVFAITDGKDGRSYQTTRTRLEEKK